MNIFVLDEDPEKAASCLCNTHLNKMLTESLQILSDYARKHMENIGILYDPYNWNHPLVLSIENTDTRIWLCKYISGIIKERHIRKMNPHVGESKFLNSIWYEYTKLNYTPSQCTFTVVRIDRMTIKKDVCFEEAVKEYRELYQWKFWNFKIPMKWYPCNAPEWLNTKQTQENS